MNATDFTDAVTTTVVSFTPGTERFRNTVSGRVMTDGFLSLACGHGYRWFPHGLRDSDPMPAAGQTMMCAHCIDHLLGDQP